MKYPRIIKLMALAVFSGLAMTACMQQEETFDPEKYLDFAVTQVSRAVDAQSDITLLPRNIGNEEVNWNTTNVGGWTSGFWPGILWYMVDYTGDDTWVNIAHERNMPITRIFDNQYFDHDLGFQFYCSFGNGLRLTGKDEYKSIILEAADSLATLYNPTAGTILSWPFAHDRYDSPHNTIIDNMMNLELLFWASKNGGDPGYYDLSVTHAWTTMENQLRDDYSSWHVVVYDTLTGEAIQKVTHQGYSDDSMWARGQAWGIYGFTMTYRETGIHEFLQTAVSMANIFIDRLPEDHVPYWDFDAPDIPNAPRDASAAAIAASALLELSGLVDDEDESKTFRETALNMLQSLSENYLSDGSNYAVLNHSVGHFTANSEVDVSIIYADYYYIEALLRARAMQNR